MEPAQGNKYPEPPQSRVVLVQAGGPLLSGPSVIYPARPPRVGPAGRTLMFSTFRFHCFSFYALLTFPNLSTLFHVDESVDGLVPRAHHPSNCDFFLSFLIFKFRADQKVRHRLQKKSSAPQHAASNLILCTGIQRNLSSTLLRF